MMQNLIQFFGFGYLTKDGETKYQFRVRKVEDLVKLFHLFDMYPLQTQKKLDAAAFLQVLNLVKAKQHLTTGGLKEIMLIKSTMCSHLRWEEARMTQYKVD